MACKNANLLNMGFAFLNYYLDLSEAIEDGNIEYFDNSDFNGTEIPSPFDYELPKQQYLTDEKREETRDWVLAVSMDREVETPEDMKGALEDLALEDHELMRLERDDRGGGGKLDMSSLRKLCGPYEMAG